MKSSNLVVGLLVTGLAYGSKPLPADVVILVRGEIAAPGAVDQDARAQVSWIYSRAGVRLTWREANPPVTAGQVVIELRYAKDAPQGVNGGALAYALPFGNGGTAITVLYDRVRFAAGRLSRETALLAHVLAHEIGHILERTNAHAPAGIMKAHWSGQDYDAMDRHVLQFTPADLDLIRLGLASLKSQSEVAIVEARP